MASQAAYIYSRGRSKVSSDPALSMMASGERRGNEAQTETKLEPLRTIEVGTYCFISLFYGESLTGELCIVPNLNRRDAVL